MNATKKLLRIPVTLQGPHVTQDCGICILAEAIAAGVPPHVALTTIMGSGVVFAAVDLGRDRPVDLGSRLCPSCCERMRPVLVSIVSAVNDGSAVLAADGVTH